MGFWFTVIIKYSSIQFLEFPEATNSDSTLSINSNNTDVITDDQFMDELIKLNGDIFWAPASKDIDKPVTLAGDEIRSVFGELPDETFNCAEEVAVPIHIEVNGNQVKLKFDPITGRERFQHCPPGALTPKQCFWTDIIEKCDKPSLAGNVNFCGTASRIIKRSIGPVDWMLLCRKSKDSVHETPDGLEATPVYADNYWHEENPYFRLYGMIGYNNVSGEVTFIDGVVRDNSHHYNWNDPFIAPGGKGYHDDEGRKEAEEFYDSTNSVNCHTCHDNKNPWIVTPHLNQSRLGYTEKFRRAAFSNNIIPKVKSTPSKQYRIIGSGYVEKRCNEESFGKGCQGLAFQNKKTNYCTKCHSLTTLNTGRLFTFAALHQTNPKMMLGHLKGNFWKELKKSTTGFGLNHGMTWMPPNSVHSSTSIKEKAQDSVNCALQYPLTFAEEAKCEYSPIFTDCPIPGGEIDTFQPKNFKVSYTNPENIIENKNDGGTAVLEWQYRNGYGDIPTRDDVRFNVRVEVRSNSNDMENAITKTRFINGVSYLGHQQFTAALPSNFERTYKLEIPVNCKDQYSFYVTPVRYCFDASGTAEGESIEVIPNFENCSSLLDI